jgi:2-dehydro-3-deoxygalactonokinase
MSHLSMASDGRVATALVAVDWGTSSFRAARLDMDGQVLEEIALPHGILNVPDGDFATFLEATCGHWLRATAGLCLISGMAGSKQGWVEAPYCPCPSGFDEVASRLKWLEPGPAHWRVAIVPGLSCELAHAPDVMRGEEVQIFGAMQLTGLREGTFILPGTHSKWASVKDGRVTHFRTYMTGEIYALLSQHSILAKTIDAGAPLDETAFGEAIALAQSGLGLLHTAFSARTLSLFSRRSAAELASYLSGLVIGEELRVQRLEAGSEVVLIGSRALTSRYALALSLRDVATRSLGSEATWVGLHAISNRIGM